jgi:hypothetical protein
VRDGNPRGRKIVAFFSVTPGRPRRFRCTAARKLRTTRCYRITRRRSSPILSVQFCPFSEGTPHSLLCAASARKVLCRLSGCMKCSRRRRARRTDPPRSPRIRICSPCLRSRRIPSAGSACEPTTPRPSCRQSWSSRSSAHPSRQWQTAGRGRLLEGRRQFQGAAGGTPRRVCLRLTPRTSARSAATRAASGCIEARLLVTRWSPPGHAHLAWCAAIPSAWGSARERNACAGQRAWAFCPRNPL